MFLLKYWHWNILLFAVGSFDLASVLSVVRQPLLDRGHILRLAVAALRPPVRQGFSGCEIPTSSDKAGTAAYLRENVQYVAAGRIRVEGYTPTKIRSTQVCPTQARPAQVCPRRSASSSSAPHRHASLRSAPLRSARRPPGSPRSHAVCSVRILSRSDIFVV